MSPVVRTQLTGLRHRPGRILLTGLSVLVAAFVVFGTVMAHEIVTRTTLDTFSDTPEGASLVVHSRGGAPLTPAQVEEVRGTSGVDQAAGRTSVTFSIGDASAGSDLDVIADPGTGPLSRITLVSGAYPTGEREIAVDRRAAGRLGAEPGSTLRLRTGERGAAPVRVTVTGVVEGAQAATERAYAPDHVVAALSGQAGYPRLDVLTAPGTDLPAMTTDLSERLLRDPRAYISVTTGEAMRVKEATDAVQQLDQLFALIAMFVAVAVVAAALVATSTFRIVFAQRLRQLALLRTIGAQRGQLVRALALEGAVIGLITGAAGVLLALAAGLATPAVAAAAGHDLSAPAVPVGAVVAVVIGAGLLTTGAVLAPAFSAAGVAPLQALRASTTVAAERGIGAPRVLLGVLLIAAAGALGRLTYQTMGEQESSSEVLLHLVGIGALSFGTLIALGPVIIRPVLAVAGWPLRRLGPAGRLAVGGIGGAPRRAAAVAVVVALGVTMLAGTVVVISSLQLWTDRAMAARTPADLAMFAEEPAGFDPVLGELRADPRFAHVTPFRMAEFTTPGSSFPYAAIDVDMARLPELAGLEPARPSPGKAVLSAGLADDLDVPVGGVVTLNSADKRVVRLVVGGILSGEGPLRASAVLAASDLTKIGGNPRGSDGVLADIVVGDRDAALAAFRRIGLPVRADVAVLADERDRMNGQVSSLLFAALGLLGLTVLIAVVGVGTTTGLSVLERTRESGLLRALGMSRSRLRGMIGMEAGLYGVIGAVLGVLLGVPFAWLTLTALRLDLPLTLPVGQLSLIVVALAAVTAGAGLLPARRAARVSPIAALAAD